ncbi:unnamed protein product [Leptidea sinapis]|uniref:RAD50-interacting protein 1 n=1 Tax=Leptidea sinapis TaxID=189913 RepID=A0A5E4PN40_9NEOP|nr:unnamed protein product [Leptidea sinapis]
MQSSLKDEIRQEILNDLNLKLGGDITNLAGAYEVEIELSRRKKSLETSLNAANDNVPSKLSSVISKAELNSKQVEKLKIKCEEFNKKAEDFLERTQPVRAVLDKRFTAIAQLEMVLEYFKSYVRVQDLSQQMKTCKDDEQLVVMYIEMKRMCLENQNSHQATYVKEYTHYWHNILKENLVKNYEDILKVIKWPFPTGRDKSSPPKEVLNKFNTMTKNLFLIQEPEEEMSKVFVSGDLSAVQNVSLPVKVLLRPLKKRFLFHFTGSRQTARIDRPEWFLTQTLTWIKDHQAFIQNNVQPIADKLELQNVNVIDEFNEGLVALAAERLHTVLGLYHNQTAKGDIVDVDAAFAHAVDETLGFHKELMEVTGYESNSVLSVLTKAETFVRWLAVEKKYALSKMDEMLDNEQWIEPVGSGVCAAVGSLLWVPRGSDWFVALLKTIEERYAILPQPGHRIQFLELQLELIEEWRVRLTQIMSATVASLSAESFLTSGPHPLTAVINTAQYIRTVLLQWAHSLHYLQLYYYKRQFQQFTQQQHRDPVKSESSTSLEYDTEHGSKQSIDDTENDTTLSLEEVESRAKHLAIKEVTRRNSMVTSQFDTPASPTATTTAGEPVEEDSDEDAGVFEDAPALFYHLRQAGLTSIIQFMLIEFREELREYRNLKWHAMLIVEERALSVSSALCKPLSGLCARLVTVSETLAPATAHFLRTELALHLDDCVFKDVVLSNWFNTGGTIQLTHDIQRNIVPALASIGKRPADISSVPKLAESCTLLNLEYEDARRIRTGLKKNNPDTISTIRSKGITTITIAEALQILNQRTDLVDASSPTSVMELF